MPSIDLSIVVPCYNEEESLGELHRRVSLVCHKYADAGNKTYEIVLINDGSKDQTWQRMLDLAAHDPHLVIVNLSRNHGHQLALTAGLSVCAGQLTLIMDADLQDPPELLEKMVGIIQSGADVVYGGGGADRRFDIQTMDGGAFLPADSTAQRYAHPA